MNYNQGLFDFIKKSPSSFHVINNIKNTLTSQGFECICEKDRWELKPGGKYYTIKNNSSIIAFVLPKGKFNRYQVIATHSDAPSFKVKGTPEVKYKDIYTTLDVEAYGGALLAPWFDRPLSIAGRIVYSGENGIQEKLVDFEKDCVCIVNLAIHLNREANMGMKYKVSKDMKPIWAGNEQNKSFIEELASISGIDKDDILDYDLYLYNRMEGKIWGANDEFISAPKLDDLQCTYSGLEAFIDGKSEGGVNVFAVFDNEEVGSATRQGAGSTFFSSVLKRIANVQESGEEMYARLLAESYLISADNAHALHPNYPERSDEHNPVHPNGGVVIKYTASQKYTTDGKSGAYIKSWCKQAGVKYQSYYNHPDVRGGSTLGSICITQVPMKAADIGAAQLAMHSPYETSGVEDTESLIKLMKVFYHQL